MVEFFEPEDEYRFDKSKKRNPKTKINFLFALVFLGILPIWAVQSDFVNFFSSEKIEEYCVTGNSYSRNDDETLRFQRAQKVINDHLETIKEIENFKSFNIGKKETFRGDQRPVINLFFKKKSSEQKRIPDTLCGFDVIIR